MKEISSRHIKERKFYQLDNIHLRPNQIAIEIIQVIDIQAGFLFGALEIGITS